MRLQTLEKKTAKNDLKIILKGCLASLLFMCMLYLIIAVLSSYINIPFFLYPVIAIVCTSLACFVGGYFIARCKRENGFLYGIIASVLFFATTFLIGTMFSEEVVGSGALVRFFANVLMGAIGGIIGVNKKVRRR